MPLPVGMKFRSQVAFYPAAYPLRALLVENPSGTTAIDSPFRAHDNFDAAFEAYADALACNPWLFNAPYSVDRVIPIRRDTQWLLRDRDGVEVPLRTTELAAWELMSVSGGHPIRVFGQFSDGELQVLSALSNGFHSFQITA